MKGVDDLSQVKIRELELFCLSDIICVVLNQHHCIALHYCSQSYGNTRHEAWATLFNDPDRYYSSGVQLPKPDPKN